MKQKILPYLLLAPMMLIMGVLVFYPIAATFSYSLKKWRLTAPGDIRFIGFEANEWLHDTDRLIAFIGGAQIDPYGNVNSTCIFGKGDYVKPQTRFTGSGGANGIATFCNTIIMMQHQKRRFMDHVDYITSCGWMDGPGGRERAGLPGNRGPQMVVTDLGIMKFDEETKRMYLAYYYPFSSPEMVQENTGFEIDVTRAELMEGPDPEIIRLIREEIDPGQAFIQVPKEEPNGCVL